MKGHLRRRLLSALDRDGVPPEPNPPGRVITPTEAKVYGYKVRHPHRTPAPPGRRDHEVVSGQYGPLQVNKRRMTRVTRPRQYWTRCDCSRELWLTAAQILDRIRVGGGCLGPECEEGPVRLQCVHNPHVSLRTQHHQLLRLCPERVANEWGGRLADSLPVLPEAAGLEQFLADVWPYVDVDARRWWVHPGNTGGLYLRDTFVVEAHPDGGLLRGGWTLFEGEAQVDVETLAQELGVDPDRALELSKEAATDQELVDALIAESLGETYTMSKATVITPEDPAYGAFTKLVSNPQRGERWFKYDEFAEDYNEAPVGSLLIMHGSNKMKISNVVHVLSNRGVERGEDYFIYRPTRGTGGESLPPGQRSLVVEKKTDREIELLDTQK